MHKFNDRTAVFVNKKWGFNNNNISKYSLKELDDITLSFALRDYFLFLMPTALILVFVFIIISRLQSNYICSLLLSLAVFIVASVYKISALARERTYVYQLKCCQENESIYTLDTTSFD